MAKIVVSGDTSGSVTLEAPAIAGTPTLTLPTTSGTILTTAGGQTVPFAAGSAAAPSITFTGDTNTGIFSPAADTIAFSEGGVESMRIDSSGNVGIGVTPQTQSTGKALEVGRAGNGIASWFNNNNIVANMYYDSVDKFAGTGFAMQYYQDASNGIHVWRTSSASGSAGGNATMTERMRITSGGEVLVGKTSTDVTNVSGTGIGGGNVASSKASEPFSAYSDNGGAMMAFYRRDTAGYLGAIFNNGNIGVTYTTASDYRLKENIAPMTGALDKLAQLKPVTYNWKSNGSAGQGFIAHELQAVVPDCVTGEKDAVDSEGKPVYQGVDTSFLVATLTAAIQEQQAMIEELKARIETLEAK